MLYSSSFNSTDFNKREPIRSSIAYIDSLGQHNPYGFGGLKPYHLGTWTLGLLEGPSEPSS